METSEVQTVNVHSNHSIFTNKLIDKLSVGKIGDVLTDEELTSVCGKNTQVGGDGYAYLLSAQRYVLRRFGLYWVRVRNGQQIKCVDAKETKEIVSRDLQLTGRRAKRIVTKLASVNIAELDEKDKREILTMQAQSGTIAMVAGKHARKALMSLATVNKPDMKRLLEAFQE